MVRVIIESQYWDILLDIKCSNDNTQIFPSLPEKKKKKRAKRHSRHHLRVLLSSLFYFNDLFRNQTHVYSVRSQQASFIHTFPWSFYCNFY